jgi:hypothetical protein
MESGCIDPHFFHLGTSWRWVVNFTPRPLYPRGKSPRYPLDRRLGGPQSQSGRFGEMKILDPHRDSNSDSSVVQPVASQIITRIWESARSVCALDKNFAYYYFRVGCLVPAFICEIHKLHCSWDVTPQRCYQRVRSVWPARDSGSAMRVLHWEPSLWPNSLSCSCTCFMLWPAHCVKVKVNVCISTWLYHTLPVLPMQLTNLIPKQPVLPVHCM